MRLLLTLLRIVGILILAVFLLVLLLVLLVLLCPVRYRVWAEKEEEKPFHAKVRIHWLLHLVSLTAEYREELTWRLRVLGITVRRNSKDSFSDAETETTDSPKSSSTENIDSENDGDRSQENIQEKGALSGEDREKNPRTPAKEKRPFWKKKKPPSDPQAACKEPEKEKVPLWEKLNHILSVIWEWLASLPEKIAALLEKWADFQENLGDYVDSWQEKIDDLTRKKDRLMRQLKDERNRFAVKEMFRTLGKLVKHIRPQKLSVRGRLGFDDPAQTGQVFGIIGMLMPLYGEHIQLEAVFDRQVMEGKLVLSGRVRIGSVIWMALRLMFRKEVRRLIAQIRFWKNSAGQVSAQPDESAAGKGSA